jgi:hypothetical protein
LQGDVSCLVVGRSWFEVLKGYLVSWREAQLLNRTTFPPIPIETAQAARAVFGRSNFYLTTGDQANLLLEGLVFDDSLGHLQMTPRSLSLLYLITIFQFVETLPDRLASDALRVRVDWKYALHLPLNYPGLQGGVLCEFRHWLLVEPVHQQYLQMLLSRFSDISDFPGTGASGHEASQVITSVCLFSRLAHIWAVLNHTMQILAAQNPEWLLANSQPHWFERYGHPNKNLDLRTGALKIITQAQAIGADGAYLLAAISKAGVSELEHLNEVLELRHVWQEQFEWVEGKEKWRNDACAGCSTPVLMFSPIIRSDFKGGANWGYGYQSSSSDNKVGFP